MAPRGFELILATLALLAALVAPTFAADFPVTVEHVHGATTIPTKPPAGNAETQRKVEAMSLYQGLKLATQGRSIWLDDSDGLASAAMSWQTPLSLGYLLDLLPPKLAAAVDGDPATAIP